MLPVNFSSFNNKKVYYKLKFPLYIFLMRSKNYSKTPDLKSETLFESIEDILRKVKQDLIFESLNRKCSAIIANRRSSRFNMECNRPSGTNPFCGLHNNTKKLNPKKKCSGFTKKGTRCNRTVTKKTFCFQHI